MQLIKKVRSGEVRYLTSSLRWQIVLRGEGWVIEPCLRLGDQEAAFSQRRLKRAGLLGRPFPLRRDAVDALEAMLLAEKDPASSKLSELI